MNNDTGFIRGNPNLKSPGFSENITKEEAEFRIREIIKCKNDIAYFANTYFTIIHLKRGKEIIKMYPEQEKMVRMMSENDRTIVSAARQIGKSTSYTIVILHEMLFKKDVKALICSNKAASALEIVGRIRLAYELLPSWLKCGIVSFNKSSMELSNGSRVKGMATSPDSARGESCVEGDTEIILEDNDGQLYFPKIKYLNFINK